jgi:RNA processing factor Prp31
MSNCFPSFIVRWILNFVDQPTHVSLLFQIIELSDYKDQVEEFRRNPVFGKSPKVTRHVGEVIGSLLISHAGT